MDSSAALSSNDLLSGRVDGVARVAEREGLRATLSLAQKTQDSRASSAHRFDALCTSSLYHLASKSAAVCGANPEILPQDKRCNPWAGD